MKVLFVTIAWPSTGERNLYSDLMDEFVIHKHEVFVLCADEKTSKKSVGIEKGIHVLRVGTLKVRKVNFLEKALALLTLGMKLKRAFKLEWSTVNIDLIISSSPTITLSGLLKELKGKLNAPLYYLLKDIWPHSFVDLGVISKYSPIYYYFRLHEIKIYKTADYIGCMSPMNMEYILVRNSFLQKEKVEVCPNSITPRILTLRDNKNAIRNKYEIPKQAIVFIFSGNICRGHGLSFYLDAIENLKDFHDAYFLIGGSGQFYNYAVREITKRKLGNIRFYKRLPSAEFDQLLLASDVGIILLDSKYKLPEFPSRLLAYLEAKKPVLCAINEETDIGKIVEDAQCGISTPHGNIPLFTQAVNFFCNSKNSEQIDKMCKNSFRLLTEQYTSTCSYNIIMKHFIF